MAHQSQTDFIHRAKQEFACQFKNRRVLEIGSLYVNGTVRPLFEDCDYVGLDCHAGRCVDVVSLAHEYQPAEPFDVVVSCEAFEHDPHLRETIDAVYSFLKPGGFFLATWAGPARPEHGTRRTGSVWGPDGDYYRGVGAQEFLALIGNRFPRRKIFTKLDQKGGEDDVYFWGFKCPSQS